MKESKKSQIWISVVIYTLVAVLGLVLILNTGIPLLTEMKDRSVVTKVEDVMLTLDRHITELASQGEGSQATVAFEIRDGTVKFEDGALVWEVETKSKIISPRTSSTQGNLIVSSNANVRTVEQSDHYLLQTDIKGDLFEVRIKKVGSPESWQTINTNELVEYISHDGDRMDGTFTFAINNKDASMSGTGYTVMEPSGNNTNLGRGRVVAHMNTTFAEYDIEFTLESYADFLTVKIKNFQPKG